jgi:hypothetical protein
MADPFMEENPGDPLVYRKLFDERALAIHKVGFSTSSFIFQPGY